LIHFYKRLENACLKEGFEEKSAEEECCGWYWRCTGQTALPNKG